MKKLFYLLVAVSVFGLAACNSAPKKEESKKAAEEEIALEQGVHSLLLINQKERGLVRWL